MGRLAGIAALLAIATGCTSVATHIERGLDAPPTLIVAATRQGRPIAGVDVKVVGPDGQVSRARTNRDGHASFEALPAGRLDVRLRGRGVSTRHERLRLVRGDRGVLRLNVRRAGDAVLGVVEAIVEIASLLGNSMLAILLECLLPDDDEESDEDECQRKTRPPPRGKPGSPVRW